MEPLSRPAPSAPRPARAVALVLALGFAVASPAREKAAVARTPPQLVPDTTLLDPACQVIGSTLDLTRGGLRIRLQQLEGLARDDWFLTHTREGVRPLPGAVLDPFVVIVLSLHNGSADDVTFMASMVSMKDEKGVEFSPLPADTLLDLFRAAFAGEADPMEPALEAVRTVHREGLLLRPGERASRLLVFPPPHPKAKRVVLSLEHVMIGPRDASHVFPYVVAGAPEGR